MAYCQVRRIAKPPKRVARIGPISACEVMETVERHREYLRAGLTSLALCAERTKKWNDGHWGAAVLAGCFLVEENDIDLQCEQAVERQLSLFIKTHRERFEPRFEPAPAAPDGTSPLVMALERNIDRLCWVGHNVIFAALSLKALRRVPELTGTIPGLARMTALFDRSIPGRSWIGWTVREVQDVSIDESVLSLTNPADVSRVVLEELSAFQTVFDAESHHDLIGHMLDFAQAVNVLHDLGYEQLFHRAVAPLRRFIVVLRSSQSLTLGQTLAITSPVDRPPLREVAAIKEDPLTALYWRRDFARRTWDGGHVFKFPYAYYDHARRVGLDVRARSRQNFMKVLGGSVGTSTEVDRLTSACNRRRSLKA
jgi:hypothetical protein